MPALNLRAETNGTTGRSTANSFSRINKLLKHRAAVIKKGRLNALPNASTPEMEFVEIIKALHPKQKKFPREVEDAARLSQAKVSTYAEALDNFKRDWDHVKEILLIYVELIEIAMLASISFSNCPIEEKEQENSTASTTVNLLEKTSELLKNFQEEDIILVLANYFKMEESIVALHQAAEKESGYTEEEKQARLFLWGVFCAFIGVIIVLLSAIVVSFLMGCGGSLPFLTYFYSCLIGSVSATAVTAITASQIVGIATLCYSCAVTVGSLFGFLMYKLIERHWSPTEFQETIKKLVRENENFLKNLSKAFMELQISPNAVSGVHYLSRENYIRSLLQEADRGSCIPTKGVKSLLTLLGYPLNSEEGNYQEEFCRFIGGLGAGELLLDRLSIQSDILFARIQMYSDAIDKFEEKWSQDDVIKIKAYLIDVLRQVIDSYSGNFDANFKIKDLTKNEALLKVLDKTQELLSALNNDDIVVILAKYFAMKECMDDLKKYAEIDAGWSEEKRKAAVYLCGIVTALVTMTAVFLLVTAAYFCLHAGGAVHFGYFLYSCLKGASAITMGCYSFAVIGGSTVSYLLHDRIIEKVIPKTRLQSAIAGLTKDTEHFIKRLGDYSKTLQAKNEIANVRPEKVRPEEEKTASGDEAAGAECVQKCNEITAYWSRSTLREISSLNNRSKSGTFEVRRNF